MVLSGIGPGCRNKLAATIGENQKELQLALATRSFQDGQRLAFEWMGLTNDRGGFESLFETGSV